MNMDLSNVQLTQDCLKEILNFGSTTYQNVCNGAINTVPWGTLTWSLFILLPVIIIGLIVLIYKT